MKITGPQAAPSNPTLAKLGGYAASIGGVAAMTALLLFVPGADRTENVSLLYLLVVMAAAHWVGRGPAVLASLLAVLALVWFFVEPRYTFTVGNPTEWLALGVFLMTAIVISELTATLHRHAEEARQREQQTAALAEASWAVASQVSHEQALVEVLRRLTDVVGCEACAIVTRNAPSSPEVVAAYANPAQVGTALPDFAGADQLVSLEKVFYDGRAVGWEGPLRQDNSAYLPIALENRVLGVLYLRLREAQIISTEERRVVESLANLAAVSLERHRLTRAEAEAQALTEADRLKTALLSMVSHDFRSPLASIKTSVTGLLQEGLPWDAAAQRELLSGIDTETDRLNRMVGNILALSRLEAGAWRPQCEMIPLTEVIGTALGSFNEEENHRIRVELEAAPAEISVDMVQFVQVLHNLLENALKYSPPGSPVVLRAVQRGDAFSVEVADCGSGIAADEAAHLFERFYRAPRWRESASPGTGIGLAVCSGLVEAHGGSLTASNSAEGGAVFCVTLPLHATADRDTDAENGKDETASL